MKKCWQQKDALYVHPICFIYQTTGAKKKKKWRTNWRPRNKMITETGFKACVHSDNILTTLSQHELSFPKLMSCLATF